MLSPGRWLLLGCVPAATLSLSGAMEQDILQRLVSNSPFQPSGTPAVQATEAAPLEFRGYVFEDGVQIFSVRDQASRRSLWLRLNEPVDGVVARAFEPGSEVLRLERAGRLLNLPLSASKVVAVRPAAPAAAPGAAPAPTTAAPAASTSPEVQAAEAKLAEARQKQAYEERRRLVLERRGLVRPAGGEGK